MPKPFKDMTDWNTPKVKAENAILHATSKELAGQARKMEKRMTRARWGLK